jgi:hypothetical protein
MLLSDQFIPKWYYFRDFPESAKDRMGHAALRNDRQRIPKD